MRTQTILVPGKSFSWPGAGRGSAGAKYVELFYLKNRLFKIAQRRSVVPYIFFFATRSFCSKLSRFQSVASSDSVVRRIRVWCHILMLILIHHDHTRGRLGRHRVRLEKQCAMRGNKRGTVRPARRWLFDDIDGSDRVGEPIPQLATESVAAHIAGAHALRRHQRA